MREKPSEAASRPAACGLRVQSVGVGGPYNGREAVERFRGQAEFLQHHIEGAGLAAMAPEDAVEVERGSVEPLGDIEDFRLRHIKENRVAVDEAANEPGAGDAVDLGRDRADPDCAALSITRRQSGIVDQQGAGRRPRFMAAFQAFSTGTGMAQPGRGTLAQFQATLAGDDDEFAGIGRRPIGSGAEIAPCGAGDGARVEAVILVIAHINQGRRIGQADQPGKLGSGNGIEGRACDVHS